jgi:polar amino acid transport system substrate-binding protein
MLSKTCATAAFLTLLASGTALAEGYDTSGITVNPDLAARVPAKIKEAGVLIGGSDNAYAPWSYLAGEDGQTPEGIDVDIGNAIAAKIPMMATTIINSIRVKPCWIRFISISLWMKNGTCSA